MHDLCARLFQKCIRMRQGRLFWGYRPTTLEHDMHDDSLLLLELENRRMVFLLEQLAAGIGILLINCKMAWVLARFRTLE